MTADEIAKLPTPRTAALQDSWFVPGGGDTEKIWALARTLEQQLAAAVMLLEAGELVFADTIWAEKVRETLAAIRR